MAVINLLDETQQALERHELSFRNIKFIKNAEGKVPIAEFEKEAANFNYENGFGEVFVDPTLCIVGKFWWMERENYNGLEGWVFHKKPKEPALTAGDFLLKNTRKNVVSSTEKNIERYEVF